MDQVLFVLVWVRPPFVSGTGTICWIHSQDHSKNHPAKGINSMVNKIQPRHMIQFKLAFSFVDSLAVLTLGIHVFLVSHNPYTQYMISNVHLHLTAVCFNR